MAKLKRSEFQFRRNDSIGAAGAESDGVFLSSSFYDSGNLSILQDCDDNRGVVLGRTGSGKSALLLKLLEENENAVELKPEELSLQYLSNSTILPYLTSLGVNLDLFYRLLWRHILTVEIIRACFGIDSEEKKHGFFQRLSEKVFPNKAKQRALEYLNKWGESFWKDTEYRIKEITEKFESDIKASIGLTAPVWRATVEAGEQVSAEQRAEIIHKAQQVVNSIQIRELSEVMRLLGDELMEKSRRRTYLLIDRLDEHWVEDQLRYRLIRALIETARDFSIMIKNSKVIIALRRDLLDRVIQATRDSGFQEEKYDGSFLTLTWTGQQLMELLDKRISTLVRRQYTRQAVTWHDLLPTTVDGAQTDKYILDRTMYRPRDIIMLLNCCIEKAEGRPEITAQTLKDAEGIYSLKRFRSLGDEWSTEFPELLDAASVLRERRRVFRLREIDSTILEEKCLSIAALSTGNTRISRMCAEVVDQKLTVNNFLKRLFAIFYHVGLVGLKPEPTSRVYWSFLGDPALNDAHISEESSAHICPIFFRVLGVNPALSHS